MLCIALIGNYITVNSIQFALFIRNAYFLLVFRWFVLFSRLFRLLNSMFGPVLLHADAFLLFFVSDYLAYILCDAACACLLPIVSFVFLPLLFFCFNFGFTFELHHTRASASAPGYDYYYYIPKRICNWSNFSQRLLLFSLSISFCILIPVNLTILLIDTNERCKKRKQQKRVSNLFLLAFCLIQHAEKPNTVNVNRKHLTFSICTIDAAPFDIPKTI